MNWTAYRNYVPKHLILVPRHQSGHCLEGPITINSAPSLLCVIIRCILLGCRECFGFFSFVLFCFWANLCSFTSGCEQSIDRAKAPSRRWDNGWSCCWRSELPDLFQLDWQSRERIREQNERVSYSTYQTSQTLQPVSESSQPRDASFIGESSAGTGGGGREGQQDEGMKKTQKDDWLKLYYKRMARDLL